MTPIPLNDLREGLYFVRMSVAEENNITTVVRLWGTFPFLNASILFCMEDMDAEIENMLWRREFPFSNEYEWEFIQRIEPPAEEE